MKKLMVVGAAALCAAVGFSDVTSANVVGYQNLTLPNASRYTMGFTFTNMDKDELKLSDIKVKGYRDSDYFMWDTMSAPKIYLKKMNDLGGTEVTYVWYDEFDEVEWFGGYWQEVGGDDITTDNDVTIPTGHGFYVECQNWQDCDSLTLECNGQVLKGTYAVPLPNASRFTIVNPMPVATTLTKIEVQGYRDSDYFMWDTMSAPKIYLKKMNDLGGTEVTYTWYDEFDEVEWFGGYWQEVGGDDITEGNDVTIGPGEGWYVECASWQDCDAITLKFPACLND